MNTDWPTDLFEDLKTDWLTDSLTSLLVAQSGNWRFEFTVASPIENPLRYDNKINIMTLVQTD